MSRPTAAPRRTTLARAGAIATAVGVAAALVVGGEAPVRAATPLTLVPIAIDGGFGDWRAVLANAQQTTHDGDGSSYAQAQCAQFSTDRDCALQGGSGNDFLTFAWTYDASNVYLYVERYGSPTNGVDLLFVADVDRDQLLTAADRVVHARWSGQTGTVTLDWSGYVPAAGSGDPIACAPVPPATHCANAAGISAAPPGFVDGYRLPGSNPSAFACTGCTGRGNTTAGDPMRGLQVEVAIPWTVFGVAPEQPFYWHAVSSNDRTLGNAVDNIGAPNGTLGSFSYYAVSLFPDRSGSVASPGQQIYGHTLRNDGNDADLLDLSLTSSQGARLDLLDGTTVVATDLTGDGTWDGEILAGWDANGDGRPDVSLAAEATRDLAVRITMPEGRSGVDVTRLTAVSAGDPLVSATATDTSQIGTASFLQPAQAGATVAGQALPFREQLRNAQALPQTFRLAADAGCGPAATGGPGFKVELAPDLAGSPGAPVAIDETGDGAWDTVLPAGDSDGDGHPDTGEIAAGATAAFHLLVTPPPGTAAGAACAVTLGAASANGAAAAARHGVAVAERLSFGPSWVGTTAAVRDAGDAQVAVGASIFLPARIVNAEAVARAYDLAVTLAGPAVGGSVRVWSDPDGDGNPSDGAVITATPSIAAWGGAAHVVVEVSSGAVPAGGFMQWRVTARDPVGGAEAAIVAEVVVGYVVAYGDPLHTATAGAFAPCDTVYVGARGLLASNVTRYALEWLPPSGPAAATVSPWPTTAIGTAGAELALAADAALGGWTARLLDGGPAPTRTDAVLFQVSLAGTASLATDRARYAPGDAVTVTASASNGGAAALRGSTLEYSGAASRTVPGVDVLPGATLADAFTFTLPGDAAVGSRTLTLAWRLSCGGAPFATRDASFDVVPRPPAIGTPAPGALLGTPDLVGGEVVLSGTAEPGATVAVLVDGAAAGTVAADAQGAWSLAVWLAEGAHAATATQTVATLSSDLSGPVSFTLDTTPPAAPAIEAPASGAITNAASVAVSGGAGDPSAVAVEIRADGVLQATAPVVAGRFDAPVTLGEGVFDLTARALDAAGNASLDSPLVALTVDRTPPAAPTWSAPSPTSATLVPVSGSAEAGAEVEILEGATVLGTTTASGAGAFSADVTLAEGIHPIAVRATDAAGNAATSEAADVVVDLTAPAAPAVGAPADDAVLAAADLVSGQVRFSGTTEPGAAVEVIVDGALAGTAVADGAGAWWVLAAVSDGTHLVRARASDLAGNASPDGPATSFTVDAAQPDAPAILSPSGPLATRLAVLSVSGSAEPGATVRLLLDGAVVETATAGGSGLFGADVPLPAGDGAVVLTAVAVDAAGNPSAPSAGVTVTVDRAAPAAATFTIPSPTALAPAPIQGTAEAGATVEVLDGGAVVATTTADGAGAFSTTAALAEGTHAVSVRVIDLAGNATTSAATAVVVDRTAPPAPSVGAPSEGAVLGLGDLSGGRVPFTGTAEAGATVELEIDGVPAATAVAGAGGAWSASATVAAGDHTVRARATDPAGNASGLSAAVGFTLDATVPAIPSLASPGAPLATGADVLQVSGAAEAGATVRLLLDGAVVATPVADGAGLFAADVALPAADGAVVLTAIAVDAGGNASAASAGVTVTVDRTAPAAPTLDAPADGAVVAPGALEVRGNAEPGSAIAVTVAGATATATAAADGSWSVTVSLPEGTHPLTARATDAAGNASAPASLTVVARTDDGGGGGGGGCGCRSGPGGGAPALLGLLALLALAPRGRRRHG